MSPADNGYESDAQARSVKTIFQNAGLPRAACLWCFLNCYFYGLIFRSCTPSRARYLRLLSGW